MRVSRIVSLLVFFVLLSAGQVYAQEMDQQVPPLPGGVSQQVPPSDKVIYKGCCQIGMCRPWCYCGCSGRVEACLDELIGGDKFTLKPRHSGPVELIAEKDVLKQLLDLRKEGKKICGNYTLKLIGNVESMTLKCTKFEPAAPISKEVEDNTRELEEAISAMAGSKSSSNSMNK